MPTHPRRVGLDGQSVASGDGQSVRTRSKPWSQEDLEDGARKRTGPTVPYVPGEADTSYLLNVGAAD
ncbi:hypothetical protein [Streptomyces sp. CC0208]|uniref:Uncharacterized protein n=1 Tax=Streptomyces sviceus (strain ATCC 29083 / DSM 924 / JCM 4929 / NBRC 13980 / NCIMB 11184 / NRRL 5439 / UC 5370) TaxID=463191 RepID=B5HUH6_STRX2|nr:hypothetical protein [Streptomyces sp. CC0208]EDY56481.1 conserved hypothetical protein [Streptomyces sviceus ATCC 29083]